MNIDIVRIHFKDNYGDDEYSYKYLPFQYCCEYLKNCPVISFGTECNTIVDDDGYLTETDVELPHFSVSWDEPIPYEDDTWSYYSKITHCPFLWSVNQCKCRKRRRYGFSVRNYE